jgi:hypothetical protein
MNNHERGPTTQEAAHLNALDLQARHDLVSSASLTTDACRVYKGTTEKCGQTANGDLVVNYPGFNQVRINNDVIEFRTGDHDQPFEVAYIDGKAFSKTAGSDSWKMENIEKKTGND